MRDFVITYQNRLLYATDLQINTTHGGADLDEFLEQMDQTCNRDCRYFATEDEMAVPEVNGPFRGLALPAGVLKKLFHDNALNWYPGI